MGACALLAGAAQATVSYDTINSPSMVIDNSTQLGDAGFATQADGLNSGYRMVTGDYFYFSSISNPESHATMIGWVANEADQRLATLSDNTMPHS